MCPASFDLGQHHNITLLSVPEDNDKPAKFPVIFRATDMVSDEGAYRIWWSAGAGRRAASA